MSDQEPEPVAWMRDDNSGSIATTTDVITKPVRDLWLKANPMQIERYTIPLYLAPPTESAIRASERERLAKWIEGVAADRDGRLMLTQSHIAACFRGIGDE